MVTTVLAVAIGARWYMTDTWPILFGAASLTPEHRAILVQSMTNIHAVDDDMYDDDDIYLGPDRCVGDLSWTDSWDREHEASCPERGVLTCCGEWWCMDCLNAHLDHDGHGNPSCWWCMDTGVIVGHFGQVDRCYWRCSASGLAAP